MTAETALIDTARLAQMVYLAEFSVSFSLVLRVAHDWFPFTPTFTSVDRQWMGWPDVRRWLLSGVLLFVVPFAYFTWMLVNVTEASIHIPLSVPTCAEAVKILGLFLLPIPLLGFYDVWQTIVRLFPTTFYSPQARTTIESRHSSAFTAGRVGTLFLGIFWIVSPIAVFFAMSHTVTLCHFC
mgnify:CR=1 FL=1